MNDIILLKLGEIVLKGLNRKSFEQKLIGNIRRRLAPLWEKGVQVAAFVDIDPKKIGQKVHGVPVIGRDGLPGPGRCFLLNALTAHGADEDAARWLAAAGYDAEQWLLV